MKIWEVYILIRIHLKTGLQKRIFYIQIVFTSLIKQIAFNNERIPHHINCMFATSEF